MSALKKICGILLSAAVLATALYSAISVAAVDTSGAKTEEWLYDFKAGTGTENAAPSFLSGTAASTESFNADQWFYNSNSSTNKSYVDQNGLHINLNYVNTVTRDSSGGSWYKKVWLWDADYDSGFSYSEDTPDKDYRWEIPSNNGFQKINDGAYAVTVKYRLSSKNTSTGKATIGIAIANYAQNPGQIFQKPLYVLDYQNAAEVSSDWTYFTAVFDGKKYSTDSGNYINLMFACDKYTADGTYNIIDIESVKVERYVDTANDEGVVRYKTYIDGGNAFGVDSYRFFSVGGGVRRTRATTCGASRYRRGSTSVTSTITRGLAGSTSKESCRATTWRWPSFSSTPAATRPSRTNFLAKATLSRSRRRFGSTHRKRTATGPAKRGRPWAMAAASARAVSRRFILAPTWRLARSAST